MGELVQTVTVHELQQTISIGQDTLEFRLTGTCVLMYCWAMFGFRSFLLLKNMQLKQITASIY